MSLPRIAGVRAATTEEWNYFAERSHHATYFHTAEWAELWHRYTGGQLKPAPKLIRFSDGTQVLMPMSASTEARGLIQQYSSSPTGKYGGWLSDQELTTSHGQALWAYVSKLDILLRQNPYDPMLGLLDIPWSKFDFTQVLDLSKGFQHLLQSWSRGHWAAVQKARRAGVVVVTAATPAEWDEYFEVYLDSLERWGSSSQSRYDRTLFEHLFRQGSANIKLWLAKYDGTVVAGAICFYHNKHAVYWHGASLEKFFKLRPVHLLHHDIIREACNAGFRWYDFNPSGGLTGVVTFKQRFGSQQLVSNVYMHGTQMAQSLRLLSKLVRR